MGFKQDRTEYQSVRADIINQVLFDYPKSSKERIEAIAFRRMNEKKDLEMKKAIVKNFIDPECTLRPDLSKTIKNTKVRKYFHNGKWEMNKIEKTECWSCCMSSYKASDGCVANIKDKHKWILSNC